MDITLAGSLLRIQWIRFADPNIEAEIVRRLEIISGAMHNRNWDCWYVPVKQMDQLLELFPKASIDAAAWAAWEPAHGVFYDMLVRLHVELEIGPMGAVFSPSLDPDHILQKLIAERSEPLKRLMNHSESKPGAEPVVQAPLLDYAMAPAWEQGRKRRKRVKG